MALKRERKAKGIGEGKRGGGGEKGEERTEKSRRDFKVPLPLTALADTWANALRHFCKRTPQQSMHSKEENIKVILQLPHPLTV